MGSFHLPSIFLELSRIVLKTQMCHRPFSICCRFLCVFLEISHTLFM